MEEPTAQIVIEGQYSKLKGDYPVLDIRTALSYPSPGAEWSDAYRRGLWDGRVHLFNNKTGKFPTGLLSLVEGVLAQNSITYTVDDQRHKVLPRNGTFGALDALMTGKYSYQREACLASLAGKSGILGLATNAGKTNLAIALSQYLEVPTLFIVTTRELLYQARARFQKLLEAGDAEVGIVGDSNWCPGTWITIATMDTLESRLDKDYCKDLLNKTQLLFIDEAHHTGSETWYKVLMSCPAYFRFGLSGTPLSRTDGADLRLIAATGPLLYSITNKMLIELGVSAKPNVIWDKITLPQLKKSVKYPTAYKLGIVENKVLLERVVDWTKVFHKCGLSTLILCEELVQGKSIDEALWQVEGEFIPHQFIHGEEGTTERKNALEDFANRKMSALIASRIADEGLDLYSVDALILAGSRKSRIKTMQRVGRGLRGKQLIVVEFANFCHKYLLEHSLQRYQDYSEEECFPIYNSGPSEALVRRLWNGENKS